MKIAVVAGGTLGHIKPGLVIAQELTQVQYDLMFLHQQLQFSLFLPIPTNINGYSNHN